MDRYDFMFMFDVVDGNPNGDPDSDNQPRVDAATGQGLVSDVCIKRKIRNYISMAQAEKSGFEIFVREGVALNTAINEAFSVDGKKPSKKDKGDVDKIASAHTKICERFFDVRTFGAVLNTGEGSGKIRGPVQMQFSRSIDKINVKEHCITRVCQTGEDGPGTMGRKWTMSYGLYVGRGFVNACLAKKSLFSEDDLEQLWQAIENMFELDRSASRGFMSLRKLIIFKHESELGNAPAHRLFDLVTVRRNDDVAVPASFKDYTISLDEASVPKGVKLIKRVW